MLPENARPPPRLASLRTRLKVDLRDAGCCVPRPVRVRVAPAHVLYCIVLYCIVLFCIVLYCFVSYCIVLYYIYDDAEDDGDDEDDGDRFVAFKF